MNNKLFSILLFSIGVCVGLYFGPVIYPGIVSMQRREKEVYDNWRNLIKRFDNED